MRHRQTPRTPDIDVLASHYLKLGLRDHPKINEQVAKLGELDDMPLLKLMKLATGMGIEPNALIESTERRESERSEYSMRYPAFRGELEFDLTIAFLEQSTIRKAKLVYEHTPDWEYFDLRKQAPYEGRGGTMYHVEVLAVPEEYDDDDQPTEGKPYWRTMDDITHDDVLPGQMIETLVEAMDAKCKVEDAERRRLATAKRSAIKSSSKRKH